MTFSSLSDWESVVGGISAFSCFLVLVYVVLFPDLRNYRYIQLAFYVAANNFIGSIGISLGAEPDGSIGCVFQAITTSFNYLSAIFWTTVMAYQFYVFVFYGGMISTQQMTWIHCICWILPLFLTLVPLTMLDFGNSDDAGAWCYYTLRGGNGDDTTNSALLAWRVFGFYIWVWLSLALSCYLLITANHRMRAMEIISNEVASTRRSLAWYPIITLIFWLPATVLDCSGIYLGSGASMSASIMCILPGCFMSILFFSQNGAVLHKLRSQLRMCCAPTGNREVESQLSEHLTGPRQYSVDYQPPVVADPFQESSSNKNNVNGITAMIASSMLFNHGQFAPSESEHQPSIDDGFSFAVRDSGGQQMGLSEFQMDDTSF